MRRVRGFGLLLGVATTPALAQTSVTLAAIEGYGNLETAGAIATIAGDTNRNASVAIHWRRSDEPAFRAAQDLLRIDATHFAVNILASHQEPISRRFSSGDEAKRFDGIGYARGQSGAALLDDALAHIECRRAGKHPAGDHTIVLGEVQTAVAHAKRPLLYYRGGYAQLER